MRTLGFTAAVALWLTGATAAANVLVNVYVTGMMCMASWGFVCNANAFTKGGTQRLPTERDVLDIQREFDRAGLGATVVALACTDDLDLHIVYERHRQLHEHVVTQDELRASPNAMCAWQDRPGRDAVTRHNKWPARLHRIATKPRPLTLHGTVTTMQVGTNSTVTVIQIQELNEVTKQPQSVTAPLTATIYPGVGDCPAEAVRPCIRITQPNGDIVMDVNLGIIKEPAPAPVAPTPVPPVTKPTPSCADDELMVLPECQLSPPPERRAGKAVPRPAPGDPL